MNRKILSKVVAGALAFTLTFANVSILGASAGEVIATGTNLEEQSTAVANSSVEFDAYFDVDGTIKHSKEIDMTTNSDKIFLNIKVTDGYLMNGTIKLTNSNFEFIKDDTRLNYVQDINEEIGTVTLNQINKGDPVILELPIRMKNDDSFEIANLDIPSGITDVLFSGTYVNNNGENKSISNTIEVQAIMTAEAKGYLDARVSKYVPFTNGETKGVVIQQVIKSRIENNVMPVRETNLEIEIPKINNIEPRVSISTYGTKATNGGEERNLELDEDYYFKANGNIFIPINNGRNTEGNIKWLKNSYDEIIVNYVYEGEIPEEVEFATNINSKIKLYDNAHTEVTKELTKTETLSTKIGDIVTFEAKTDKETLPKGYIYVSGAENTTYTEKWNVNVSNKDIVANIVLKGNEYYLDKDNNRKDANIVYTKTRISQENFLSTLGETGEIKIYNTNDEENPIATLNKDNLEYTYTEEITSIKVVTSKPISEGTLKIENERGIKADQYDKASVLEIDKLVVGYEGRATIGTNGVLISNAIKTIELTNPTTKFDTTINTKSLSTIQANTNVEIRVVLNTSENTCDLYKNPKIEVEFPTYVKSIKNVNVAEPINGQGLTLGEYRTKTNAAGNIVEEINLVGEQIEFNTSNVYDGAVVVLQGDIEVDELTPAVEDTIKVYVENENATSYINEENGKGINYVQISYAAEKTIITRNMISGYNDAGEEVKALSSANTATILPNAEARTATIKIDAVNSTGDDISNVKILGRVPFAGNKTVTTNEALGSAFTANMTSVITGVDGTNTNDVDVYYSENGEATTNLTDTNNGWTSSPSDLSKVKSYLIVFKAEVMENGQKASFAYTTQIPANLEGEKATYSSYAVYYTENTTEKSKEAKAVGLVTSKVEEPQSTNEKIDVSVVETSGGKTLTTGDTVKEGQYVDYAVTIKNKSNENLTLDLEISKENAKFYGSHVYSYTLFDAQELHKYDELEDEKLTETITIEPNKTYTYKYTLVVDLDAENELLQSIISIKENDEKIIDDITMQNPIENGLIKVNLKYNGAEESVAYSRHGLPIVATITNISGSDLTDLVVEIDLPEILSYNESTFYENNSDVNSIKVNGQNLEFMINELKADEEATIYILTKVGSIGIEERYQYVTLNSTASVNGETYSSNSFTSKIEQGEIILNAKMTGSVQGQYVNDGDEIIYTIEIENKGILNDNHLTIEDIIPNCLQVQEYTIIENDGSETTTSTSYNNLSITNHYIYANSKITLKIKTEVKEILAENEIITNKAKISGAFFDTFETNTVTYKIKKDNTEEPSNPQDPSNPDNPDNPSTNKYEISGRVWHDANFDGKRDLNENGLSGIEVMLMNNQKSEFVKDSSGNVISTLTQADGTYKFEGLQSGEYVVIFIYDTEKYKPTTYQKVDVSNTVNSDAIDTQIRINGVDTKIAATDIIAIGEANRENIDLGLVDLKVFDLKLEKDIKTVIVQNKQGTETYTFEDGKNAKIEIPSKYMVGTTLTVEYRIRITNEGDITGKVLKVVDYMPRELEFSSEINLEWYKGTDGNLYTEEFKEVEIKPGETKEITLVLTKQIKEEAAEISSNTAEIAEIYNTEGKQDIDSTPGNNAQGEDDISNADLIVTIKTGVTTYILISVGIILTIAIFAGGIYLIKKKVLTEEI